MDESNQFRKSFEIHLINTSLKIKEYKNQNKLTACVILICFSAVYYGWSLVQLSAVPNTCVSEVFGEMAISPSMYGTLQGSLSFGAIFGALISAILMIMQMSIGRRFLLLINLLALTTICLMQIPNVYVLLVCRIFLGIYVGCYMAIIPLYINDMCPKQLISSYGTYTHLFVVVGILSCFIFSFILTQINLTCLAFWRIIFLFNIIFILIQTICLLNNFIPESPNSLIIRKEMSEAKAVLEIFHQEQFISKALQVRMIEVQLEVTGFKTSSNAIKISPLAYLFAFSLPLCQQLTGIAGISAQCGKIIGAFNASLGNYIPIIINFAQLIGNYIAVWTMPMFGRRFFQLSGSLVILILDISIATIFIYVYAWSPGIILISVLLILYMIAFGMTLGPITWMYIPEIIPANAVPFATASNWIGTTIVQTIVPIVTAQFDGNPYALFYIFSGITLFFLIFNFVFMIETKDISKEVIAMKFEEKCNGCKLK